MRAVCVFLCLAAAMTWAPGSQRAEAAPADGITIVRDSSAKAAIVLAADANEKDRTAAADLRTYIRKISGATLPITTDSGPPQGALILVGRSRLTDAMGVHAPSGLTSARREEGFTIVCRGNRLVLAGNDAGPYHGTQYAVYDFLNRLGVRWFMPGAFGEYIPRRSSITFGRFQITEKPDFMMRNWWVHQTPEEEKEDVRWKIRNKMNPDLPFAPPSDGSSANLIPASKYLKIHPEYYAKNQDGSPNPGLPSFTNPDAVRVAAATIKDFFRSHPEANCYAFSPPDGMPRDWSSAAVALNQGFEDPIGRPGVPQDASISEEWFRFVNAVTQQVRAEFPNVYIATNGYANRTLPPQGFKLNDHVIVMFAAIWSCTLHPFDDPHCWQRQRMGQMLSRWCRVCPNVWLYGYNEQMLVSALTPLPETRKIRRELPLMKKWGGIGFNDEARDTWAEPGIASRYLRAKLEWNSRANADAILNDFYTHWYGKAAGPARAFYDALEDAIQASPMHGHEDRILPEIYTAKLMKQLAADLQKAASLADSERSRLHVRIDKLIFDHLRDYVAMSRADAAGSFSEAVLEGQKMLAVRKQLHTIDSFLMPEKEEPYSYFGVPDRVKFYESLADKQSGKTGHLITLFPSFARFRTDPFDDGLYAPWYASNLDDKGWKQIDSTRPFYAQGYEDARGFPYVGNIWYRFTVKVPASAAGHKVMLDAPVIETEGWCWVNGQYVGHRPYIDAYIRPAEWECDVTRAIRPGRTNEITFRVNTSLAAAQAADGLESRLFLYSPITTN